MPDYYFVGRESEGQVAERLSIGRTLIVFMGARPFCLECHEPSARHTHSKLIECLVKYALKASSAQVDECLHCHKSYILDEEWHERSFCSDGHAAEYAEAVRENMDGR